MNIFFYAAVSNMNHKAVERFLNEHYSSGNVLLYDIMKSCKFHPKVKKENIYNAKQLHERNYRKIKGYYDFPPIDADLIRTMGKYEGEIYKMMDSFFPPIDNFNDRQRIYFNALRLLNGIIEKNQIDCYMMFGIPHQVFDYIIYCLCKCKNIKTIMVYRLPVIGYTYYFYDLENHLINSRENPEAKIEDLYPAFVDSYNQYIHAEEGVKLYYMRSGSFKDTVCYFGRRVRQFSKYKGFFRNAKAVCKLYLNKRKTERTINRISEEPDFSKKYLYFGLHFQPEGTTSPSAGVYVNQQLIIQMLSYVVPDDLYIYVKEHPSQGMLGKKDQIFYEEIAELRNVVVVPTATSSNELEKYCLAIVTCTGTIAYEAMFKKKPSILFGYYIYNYLPGAYTVKNLSDCKAAVRHVLDGVEITDQQIVEFMYKIQSVSYHTDASLEVENFVIDQGISIEESNEIHYRLLCDSYKGLREIE